MIRWGLVGKTCAFALAAVVGAVAENASAATYTWVANSGNWTIASSWSPSGAPSSGNGYYASGSSATVACPNASASETFAGSSLTLSSGAELNLYESYSGGGATYTMTIPDLSLNGATLNAQSTVGTLTFAVSSNAPIALSGANSFVMYNGSYDLSLTMDSGLSGNGSVAVTRHGSGDQTDTFTLDGSYSSYSGNMAVTGISSSYLIGTTIGNSTGWGTGNLTLNNYTTLNLSAAVNSPSGSLTLNSGTSVTATVTTAGTIGSISGVSGSSLVLASSLTTDNNGSTNYAGAISGAGGLTMGGTGLFTLSGANSYTGLTAISGGTLQVGAGGTAGSLSSSSAIVDNSALIYSYAGTSSVASLPTAGVTGTGTVTATGGNITLNGNVTTTGSQSYNATNTNGVLSTGVQIAATTVTLATTGPGASISLTGDVGKASSVGDNLVLSTSAGNGPINLNVSIGRSGDWYSLSSFTANAGTGAINWSGSYGANDASQSTPINLTGAINFSGNFACNAASPLTMTLNPTEPSTVSGVLSGPLSLVAAGPNSVALGNSNTYTGSTTVSGGTLLLNYAAAGAPVNNIVNQLSDSSSLTVSAGTLIMQGNSGASNSQQFNGLTVNAGLSSIAVNSGAGGSANLSLGSINRNAGGFVNFSLPSSGNISTTSPNNSSGILGPWALVGGSGWATVSGGFITAYAGYTNVNVLGGVITSNSASNVAIVDGGSSGNVTFASSAAILSTLTQSASLNAGTIALAGGTFQVGGIMNVAGAQALTIGAAPGDGTLSTSTAGGDLVLVNNSGNSLTINSVVADNGTASTLNKFGAGLALLTAGNTYSGGTSVFGGTLAIAGTGSLGGGNYANSITNSGALAFGTSTPQTLSGVISGNGALIQNGPGTVFLTNNNPYTGTTTIGGGTLQLGAGGTSGSVGGPIVNNGALVYTRTDSSDTNTLANNISGSGSLTVNGGGLVVVTGANTYSGITTITNGSWVSVTNINNEFGPAPSSFVANQLSFTGSGGAIFNMGAGFPSGNSLTIDANRGIFLGSGATATFRTGYSGVSITINSIISGSGNIAKTDTVSDSLILNAANTFTGNTSWNTVGGQSQGGIIQLGNANAVQYSTVVENATAGGGLTFTGGIGTFTLGGLGGTVNQALTDLNSAAVTLMVGNNNTSTTYSGALSGSGALAKIGSGMLTLSGSNVYTGITTIGGGTLQIGGAGSLGSGTASVGKYSATISNSGTLLVNTSGNQTFAGVISGTGPFYQQGSGITTLSASNTYTGATTVSNGTLAITSAGFIAAASPIIVAGGALLTTSANNTFGNPPSGSWTISGTMYGAGGSVAQTMPSSVTLNNGTMSGPAYTAYGTFLAGAGVSPTLTANGGSNTISAGNLGDGTTITFNTPQPTDALTVMSVIGASSELGGSLIKTGSGTLTLSASNIYTGSTTISGGTLKLGIGGLSGSFGTGAVVNNSALVITRSDAQTSSAFTLANNISGSGTLTANGGGCVVLSGSNTYTGITTISNSSSISMTNVNAELGPTPASFVANQLSFTGAGGSLLNLGPGFSTSGSLVIDANRGVFVASGATATFRTGYSGNTITINSVISGSGNIAKTDTVSDSLILNAANTFTGTTGWDTVGGQSQGGFIRLGNPLALQYSTLNENATAGGGLTFTGSIGTFTLGGLSGAGSQSLTDLNSAAVALQVGNNNANTTYSGILSGAGTLTKIGSGTLSLSGSSTYSGQTNANSGSLLLSGGSLNAASAISIAAGATFGGSGSAGSAAVTAGGTVLGGYNGSGNLNLASLTYSGSGGMSFGALANYASTPAITVSGSNALTTSGANSITITVGSLAGTSSGAYQLIGFNGAIQGSGSAAFQLGILPNRAIASLSLVGNDLDLTLSGGFDYLHWTGAISSAWDTSTQGNSQNWILNSNSTATGFINGTPTGGDTVVFDNTAGTNTSVSLSTTLYPTAVTVSSSNNYTFSGSGSLAGATSLTIVGPGSLTLANSGGNSYTGGTFLQGGTLVLGAGNALPAGGALTMGGSASNATLDLAGNSQQLGSLSVALGATASGQVIGSSSTSSLSTLIYGGSGGSTFGGTIQDSVNGGNQMVALAVTGGLLNLSGSNTFSGPTTISAGTLQLGSPSALYSGAAAGNVALNGVLDLDGNSAQIGALSGSGTVTSSAAGAMALTVGVTNSSGTFSGSIANGSGTVSLAKAGSGNWTISGSELYTGSTTVSGGTLAITGGFLQGVSPINVAAGALLTTTQNNTFSGSGSVNGESVPTGAWTVSGTIAGTANAQTMPVSVALNNGTLSGNTNTNYGTFYENSSGTITAVGASNVINAGNMGLNGSLTVITPSATDGLTVSAVLGSSSASTGGLIAAGNGLVTLSASNIYTGATTVTGGSLIAANNSALVNSSAVTLSPAVAASLLFSTAAPTIGSLSSSNTGTSNVVLAAGGIATTLSLGGNNSSTTYAGAISDLALSNTAAVGSLTKVGAGAFTMSGTNSYTGVTIVNAGTVNVYNDQSAANGGWYLYGSNLANAATVNFEPGSTVAVAAGNQFIVGVASAGNHDTQTLNVSGTVNNSGSFVASRGSSIDLFTGGQWNQGGAMSLVGVGGYAALLTVNPGASFAYTGTATIQMAPGTSNGSGYIYDNGLFATDQGFQRSVNLGGGFNNTEFIMGGGTLQLLANVPQLLISSGTDTIAFVLSTGGGVFDTQGFSTTMSGAISGTGSLTKIGSGMLTLAGTNTYTGNTSVTGGTLQLGNSQALGNVSSVLATASSGVVDLNGYSTTVGAIGGTGGIITDNSLAGGTTTLYLNLFSNATYGGSLQDGPSTALSLAQYGTAKLTLTGSSTLGGGLNDANGEALEIDGAVATPTLMTGVLSPFSGSGSITLTNPTSGLYYQSSANSTFSGAISGTGGVNVSSGMLTLTASNTYSGPTVITAGTLMAGAAGALSPNSSITLNGGVLDVTQARQTIAGLTINYGTLNLDVSNYLNVTGPAGFGGVLNLSDLAGLTPGANSLELIGYTSYSGSFSNSSNIPGYYLSYTTNQLDLVKNGYTGGAATWSSSAGGSWTVGGNWSTGMSPNGQAIAAVLGSALLASDTVSLDSPQTLGSLTFDNSAAGYTITAGSAGNLTLDNTGGVGDAQIVVLSGTHSLAASLTLAGTNTSIAISGMGSLDISGNILDGTSGSNASLTLSSSDGTGLLSLDGSNTFGGGVNVQSGTLILNGAAALLPGSSLVIGSAAGGGDILLPATVSSAHAAPVNLTPVPEPSTLALLATGALLAGVYSVGFSSRTRAKARATGRS